MASIFDKLLPKQAASMLKAYGRTVTLKKVAHGAVDPDTGNATETTSSTQLKCNITPVRLSVTDGSNLIAGDVIGTFYAQGASAVPEVGDMCDAGDGMYRIVSVSTIYSGEVIAMYEALMRK